MRVLDLFSGIGGFSLGFEKAGMQTAAFCEINDFCRRVLNERWPAAHNFRGIYALNSLLRRVRKRSSQPDFRVKISHSLEKVPDLPVPVLDSSGHSFVPFAWYDHSARCWRTWQRCLVEGWTPFSGAWPRSGMTRSGIAYRRQPLVRLTSGTASGSLLPTPEATNTKAIALRSAGRSPRNFLSPLPTPTASSYGSNKSASSGAKRRPSLAQIAKTTWPTPVARDYKGQGMSVARRASGQKPDNLCSAVLLTDGSGALNPPWVEWLMGFPIGWTACAPSVTPSSRKSRKSSAGRS